jgi:YgiT-type zinc finger domain-containing protein
LKCPCCGAADLVHDTRDEIFTSKDGIKTIIPAVTGDYCPACGESLLGSAETERAMGVLRTAINAGVSSGPGVNAKEVFERLERKYALGAKINHKNGL